MIALAFDDVKFNVEFSRKIAAAKNPTAILLNSGREVANQLKKHFRAKDRSGANKMSERRSHFWLAVSRTVQNPELSGNTVSVAINDPRFAQKVFGGPIVAKEAEALTIPEEERAYGRTTQTFEAETGLKLFLIRTGKGAFENAVLAVKDDSGRGFTVEYLLTKSVDQKADTDALPNKTALETAILARAQKVLDRQMSDDTTPPPEAAPET
jgi:hypothetical protein